MNPIFRWAGSTTGIAGALLVAMNIPASGWGFPLFLASSLAWLTAAIRARDHALALMQAVFTAINILGIWRWLCA